MHTTKGESVSRRRISDYPVARSVVTRFPTYLAESRPLREVTTLKMLSFMIIGFAVLTVLELWIQVNLAFSIVVILAFVSFQSLIFRNRMK